MNKNKILAILALLLIGVIAFLWGRRTNYVGVNVELSKQMYQQGEKAEVTIKNNSFKKVCFSTCFPYYLQFKDEGWNDYEYPSCKKENLNVPCIGSSKEKTFRFTLNKELESKVHRIAVPINKGGESGNKFEEDQKVYSEAFEIK